MLRFLIAAFAILAPIPCHCVTKGSSVTEKKAKAVKVFFALKRVHPQTAVLAPAIEKGEPAPAGYTLFPMDLVDDETGKKIGETPILLRNENILTEEVIESADPLIPEGVSVKLNKEGGKLLNETTKEMELGVDRMAIVFEGRCVIAPTVNAVLSRSFVINGLAGRAEVDRVVKLLNNDKAPK